MSETIAQGLSDFFLGPKKPADLLRAVLSDLATLESEQQQQKTQQQQTQAQAHAQQQTAPAPPGSPPAAAAVDVSDGAGGSSPSAAPSAASPPAAASPSHVLHHHAAAVPAPSAAAASALRTLGTIKRILYGTPEAPADRAAASELAGEILRSDLLEVRYLLLDASPPIRLRLLA